eukprot:gene6341-9269_t
MTMTEIVSPRRLQEALSTALGDGIHSAILMDMSGNMLSCARSNDVPQEVDPYLPAILSNFWLDYQASDVTVVSDPRSLVLECEEGKIAIRSMRRQLLLVLMGGAQVPLGFLDSKAAQYVDHLNQALPDLPDLGY